MDVFPLVLALVPLGTYFTLVGALRCTGRPLVTTSARDASAMWIAVSGLVMIGPVHLFFPSTAAAELGPLVWVILGVLYLLCVSLFVMSERPRIIVYGMRAPEVLEVLLAAARTVDPSSTADGERMQVSLNDRRVRLRVEPLGMTDAARIESFEPNLHPDFWRHLLLELRGATQQIRSARTAGGAGMLAVGIALLVMAGVQAARQPDALMAGFREWMRL